VSSIKFFLILSYLMHKYIKYTQKRNCFEKKLDRAYIDSKKIRIKKHALLLQHVTMILIDSVSLNLGPGNSGRTSLGTDEQLLSIGSKCLIEPFRATICQVWRLRKGARGENEISQRRIYQTIYSFQQPRAAINS